VATRFGRYDLVERISVGGMAEVFRACATGAAGVEKTVALKRILPEFSHDEMFVSMFIEEARISLGLNHSNIGQVYEFGQIDGCYYLAMEYIQGKDVGEIRQLLAAHGATMPVPMAIRILLDVLNALHYAHHKADERGDPLHIVHRDVTPPNVLVSMDGTVKLIDFGIAKMLTRSPQTAVGLLKGKFGYLSPEQAAGKEIDDRSDLYSLGAVFFELLSGRCLYEGDDRIDVLLRVRRSEVPDICSLNPRVPGSLATILGTALSRDRDRRYQSAADFYEALEGFAHQERMTFSTIQLSRWMSETFGARPREVPAAAWPLPGGTRPVLSLRPEPALVTSVGPRAVGGPPRRGRRPEDTWDESVRFTSSPFSTDDSFAGPVPAQANGPLAAGEAYNEDGETLRPGAVRAFRPPVPSPGSPVPSDREGGHERARDTAPYSSVAPRPGPPEMDPAEVLRLAELGSSTAAPAAEPARNERHQEGGGVDPPATSRFYDARTSVDLPGSTAAWALPAASDPLDDTVRMPALTEALASFDRGEGGAAATFRSGSRDHPDVFPRSDRTDPDPSSSPEARPEIGGAASPEYVPLLAATAADLDVEAVAQPIRRRAGPVVVVAIAILLLLGGAAAGYLFFIHR
jgi:serine/threonine protein kinase